MKNIHVLSTNKQSRLWTNNLKRRLELDEFYSKHQTNLAKHIYITSDELTKEGYMYDIDGDVGKAIGSDMKEFEGNKKIILTTDLDLIADGVQAIDDEFLEWFIKNPSCELIEIQCRYNFYAGQDLTHYKIIIPKEESKQSEIEQASIELVQDGTIEGYYDTFAYYEKKGFVKGVEWQIDKQDEFTLGFLHWYNTSQECETYLRRNYPKNITMNGEHYKKVLEINKELLEMYKNTLPR
jgi:hypothetical protein